MPHFLSDAGISPPSVIEHLWVCDYHGTSVDSYLKSQRLRRSPACWKIGRGGDWLRRRAGGFWGRVQVPVGRARVNSCCGSLKEAVLNELVAQLVEQRPFKAWVVGSIPTELTTQAANSLPQSPQPALLSRQPDANRQAYLALRCSAIADTPPPLGNDRTNCPLPDAYF